MSIESQPVGIAQRGVTLVELVVFIVVVSVGVVGLLSAIGSTVRHSADPMARKQALVIAESLLREIEQQPFTYCDPQDENVLTATSAAGCFSPTNDQNKAGAALPAVASPAPTPASETRGSNTDPYDNVADYAGYQASADVITGNAELADYTASVTISRVGGIGAFATVPHLDAVLKIDVRVSGRGEDVLLTGHRIRHAPNSPG